MNEEILKKLGNTYKKITENEQVRQAKNTLKNAGLASLIIAASACTSGEELEVSVCEADDTNLYSMLSGNQSRSRTHHPSAFYFEKLNDIDPGQIPTGEKVALPIPVEEGISYDSLDRAAHNLEGREEAIQAYSSDEIKKCSDLVEEIYQNQ